MTRQYKFDPVGLGETDNHFPLALMIYWGVVWFIRLKAITEINEWEACFVKMTSNVMHQAISLDEVRLENQSNMI
jgi:hypothetical protein